MQAWGERDQEIKGEGRRTESVAIGVICGSVRGLFPARRDARGSDSTSGTEPGRYGCPPRRGGSPNVPITKMINRGVSKHDHLDHLHPAAPEP